MCFSKDTHKWKCKPQTGQSVLPSAYQKRALTYIQNSYNSLITQIIFFNGQKMWIVSLQKINVDGKYSHEKMPNMMNH